MQLLHDKFCLDEWRMEKDSHTGPRATEAVCLPDSGTNGMSEASVGHQYPQPKRTIHCQYILPSIRREKVLPEKNGKTDCIVESGLR